MKYTINTIIFLIISHSVLAQNLHDRNWIVSNSSKKPVLLQWVNQKLAVSKLEKSDYAFSPVAVISNKLGQLRYSSNGCAIMGANNKVLPNGDTINPGDIWKSYCRFGGSYPARENTLLLPMPKDTSRYFTFHTAGRKEDVLDTIPWPHREFYYSEIISTLNNGIGAVVKKNVLVKSDTFYQGVFACRHANGNDWWVIVPQLVTLGFHRTLLTSKGVQYAGIQNIQANKFASDTDKGQSNFSPDGTMYATGDPYNGIRIFDFDRCTGLFSNMRYIDIGYNQVGCVGVEFSPNSRFLYVTHLIDIWQYDLQAKNIKDSKILIDTFDGFEDPYPTTFYQSQLAPDSKIYIGGTNATYYMSVIHSPDSLGKACNFKQHDLKLPEFYYVDLPNMPNYRLGASDPNCALPVATKDIIQEEIPKAKVFPNPTRGNIMITAPIVENNAIFILFDTRGKQVFTHQLQSEKTTLDLPSHLPQGIYFWQVLDGVKPLQSGKLVLIE